MRVKRLDALGLIHPLITPYVSTWTFIASVTSPQSKVIIPVTAKGARSMRTARYHERRTLKAAK